MEQKRITTALIPAVGAAAEQSSENMYAESIADPGRKSNGKADIFRDSASGDSIDPGHSVNQEMAGSGIALNTGCAEIDGPDDGNNEELYCLMRQMADPGYLPTISMAQLYEEIYQARPRLIENLLYPGTYLFVGAPKLGKSFLMLQIAYHVATGMKLWEYPVRQGTVLYLALEDDPRRLQDRLYRTFGTECTEHLHLATRADFLNGNLLTQMRTFISRHPDTGLIIIDTLQKVRECADDRYSYANDYIKKAAYSMSWTLSQETAEWFMKRHELTHPGEQHLYKGTISADRVIAYIGGRNEFEIVQYRGVRDIEEIPLDGLSPEFETLKNTDSPFSPVNPEKARTYYDQWYKRLH